MMLTVDDVLYKTAAMLRDPSCVVLNVNSIYEDADGNGNAYLNADDPRACRACLLGMPRLAARGFGVSPYGDVASDAQSCVLDLFGDATGALDQLGPIGCADMLVAYMRTPSHIQQP